MSISPNIIQAFAIFTIIYVIGWGIYCWWMLRGGPFRYEKTDEFRRWCRACDQEQIQMVCTISDQTWWVPVGLIKQVDCRCHRR